MLYLTQKMYDDEITKRLQELEEVKESHWNKYVDCLTCRKIRKTTLGTWTEQDEKEYLAKNKEVEELIKLEEAKVYPEEGSYTILSQEEYDKMEEEARKLEEQKRIEEEMKRMEEEKLLEQEKINGNK